MIEIFEPGSKEEEYAVACFAQAKVFLENEEKRLSAFVPVAFIVGGDESVTIMPLIVVGGEMSEEVKDAMAAAIRAQAAKVRAVFIATIFDTYRTRFRLPVPELRRRGLVPEDYKIWPRKQREDLCIRTECLQLMMETRGGFRQVAQTYTRKRGEILWGDCDVATPTKFSGRFVNLLPKVD